jgi:imidazolonepropionase-like amidohydrolase
LGLGRRIGSIEPGLQADLICFKGEDHRELAYYFGGSALLWTMKKGTLVYGGREKA